MRRFTRALDLRLFHFKNEFGGVNLNMQLMVSLLHFYHTISSPSNATLNGKTNRSFPNKKVAKLAFSKLCISKTKVIVKSIVDS